MSQDGCENGTPPLGDVGLGDVGLGDVGLGGPTVLMSGAAAQQ